MRHNYVESQSSTLTFGLVPYLHGAESRPNLISGFGKPLGPKSRKLFVLTLFPCVVALVDRYHPLLPLLQHIVKLPVLGAHRAPQFRPLDANTARSSVA